MGSTMMKYEAVIGLEIHAQMLTNTKIFCGCPTNFGAEPNSQTCPVCSGMPGVLPVLNKKAVELAIKTGIALNCKISDYSRFARKNYFYPDLPKNYQISQYELPLCEDGYIEIIIDGSAKKIGIKRIHLEEDAGKNIHTTGNYSFVDFNRAGVPLMEIVTEPDIRTPQEAALFMRKLRTILRYIDVCDGNMEQGSLRCDANVSVRLAGQKYYGIRTEIKNINSFKFVQRAIEYEIDRQIAILERGDKVVQETRLWDPERGVTISMRSKEEAHDYRYFPEPDLVPLVGLSSLAEKVRGELPELPDAKGRRFVSQYRLSESEADILISERAFADWFEEAVKFGKDPKVVANWMLGELLRLLKEDDRDITKCPLKPAQLAEMLSLIEKGIINIKIAKIIFEEMYRTGKDAHIIVKEKGLVQITDENFLNRVIEEILSRYPQEVQRYRAGEEKLMGFFVGQIMKATKGKANPQLVNEMLKKKL
ncbi:MAG: Asp-tRNA(Asn)/Glu-tRNA(Gln) amidotransferase subunit GatB [Thermodesulfovibrionales bacterium]|nr:Asp-tRNA(Asn)/Glu-tRNA(Gln) amidotransferase subunit GatB [Thermodesulfovibrionales bacterium]